MKQVKSVKLHPEEFWPPALPPKDLKTLKPAAIAGLRFQQKAERLLRKEFHSWPGATFYGERWFSYFNISERKQRYCAPDAFAIVGETVVLFEMKLNFSHHKTHKLRDLYRPVLEAYFNLPVICMMVVRCVRSWRGPVFFSAESALESYIKNESTHPFQVILIP